MKKTFLGVVLCIILIATLAITGYLNRGVVYKNTHYETSDIVLGYKEGKPAMTQIGMQSINGVEPITQMTGSFIYLKGGQGWTGGGMTSQPERHPNIWASYGYAGPESGPNVYFTYIEDSPQGVKGSYLVRYNVEKHEGKKIHITQGGESIRYAHDQYVISNTGTGFIIMDLNTEQLRWNGLAHYTARDFTIDTGNNKLGFYYFSDCADCTGGNIDTTKEYFIDLP